MRDSCGRIWIVLVAQISRSVPVILGIQSWPGRDLVIPVHSADPEVGRCLVGPSSWLPELG